MRSIAIALFFLGIGVAASPANATCVGTGALSNCWDDNGNSYTVQRFGNQTFTNGYNARTGSSWSQNSNTLGNTTFHNGQAANGNSWNMTDQRLGNTRLLSGTDSQGRAFNYTCGPLGCN